MLVVLVCFLFSLISRKNKENRAEYIQARSAIDKMSTCLFRFFGYLFDRDGYDIAKSCQLFYTRIRMLLS